MLWGATGERKAGWNTATMANGMLSALTTGTSLMLMWSALLWDTPLTKVYYIDIHVEIQGSS